MKGTNIGELEELVLLVVANLYENAYGVAIRQEIVEKSGRNITISTVHNVLQRLQEKDFLESSYSDPTPERGGKRKLLFKVTRAGQIALENSRELRESLWKTIPKIAFDNP